MQQNKAQKVIEEVKKIAEKGIVIIATGPLTSEGLSKEISKITGEDKLHFYDAAAPIVTKESIDFNIAFFGNRYEQEKKNGGAHRLAVYYRSSSRGGIYRQKSRR